MHASKPLHFPDSVFDPEGFLSDPQLWDESLAVAIARHDGLELTPAHWRVIRALREHFHKFGAVPPAFSHLCIVNHLDKHCVDDLFHSLREAWRVTGLPDPGEEAKSYM
jgi:TusE/DsrC/DsvC family sulfur relay protein